MKRRIILRAAPAIALAATAVGAATVLAVATTGTAAASSAATATVRYQDSPGTLSIIQLAKALGYIPGITIQNEGFVQGGPQALQALGTGQVDIAGAFTGAIADVVAHGSPVKAVISFFGDVPNSPTALVVKKGSSSSLSKPKDWIGKKVGVNTLGAQSQAILDTWFLRGGLTPKQIKSVTLVPLPSLDLPAAVEHGQIDGAMVSSAVFIAAQKAGDLTPVLKDTDLFGPFNGDQYAMADSWLKANPAGAKEFIGGMAKAVVWAQSHTRKQVLAKFVPWLKANKFTEDAKALASWTTTGISTKGGYVTKGDFTKWWPWLKSQGLIKGTENPGSMFTNEFNPYAPKS